MAQRLAQATHNRLVTGSNPVGPTKEKDAHVAFQANECVFVSGNQNLFRNQKTKRSKINGSMVKRKRLFSPISIVFPIRVTKTMLYTMNSTSIF